MVHVKYRGNGEPLIGFWPYFLQEYSSGGISATFELIAGTLIVLLTLDFLQNKSNPVRFWDKDKIPIIIIIKIDRENLVKKK